MSGHPAADIAVILAFAVAVLAALWLRAGKPPRPRLSADTDPLYAAHIGADDDLRRLGHDPSWTAAGSDAVRATCDRCAGVLTISDDAGAGLYAEASPPLAGPDGRLIRCSAT